MGGVGGVVGAVVAGIGGNDMIGRFGALSTNNSVQKSLSRSGSSGIGRRNKCACVRVCTRAQCAECTCVGLAVGLADLISRVDSSMSLTK